MRLARSSSYHLTAFEARDVSLYRLSRNYSNMVGTHQTLLQNTNSCVQIWIEVSQIESYVKSNERQGTKGVIRARLMSFAQREGPAEI